MSEAPWTPGPWRIKELDPYRNEVEDETGYYIARLGEVVSPRGGADARLIAAAPELVDLLVAVSGDLGPILAEKTAGGVEVSDATKAAIDHLQDVRLLLIRIGRAKP